MLVVLGTRSAAQSGKRKGNLRYKSWWRELSETSNAGTLLDSTTWTWISLSLGLPLGVSAATQGWRVWGVWRRDKVR